MNRPFAPRFDRWRPWLGWIVFLALAIVAQAWLQRVMVDQQVVASLLSPGPHLDWSRAAIAIGFLMLRILVVFCLPGLLLSRLGLAIYDHVANRSPQAERIS